MRELDKALLKLAEKNKPLHQKDRIKYTEDIIIKKVAFDVYKIDNGQMMKDHYEGLWTLEEHGDSKFLVRASDPKFEHTSNNDWSVSSAYDSSNVVLAYRNIPVANFTPNDFGYDGESISLFKQAVLDKVTSDEEFTTDVISVQEKSKIAALKETFPELKKYKGISMSIKKLLKQSQELLNKMDSGKEFTSKHVYTKLAIAADKHPNDILLNTMRDVMAKTAAKQQFISQKEIADVYNRLYKYSGSFSNFRSELPEFLPQGYGQGKASTKDASTSRVDMGKSLEPLQDFRTDLNPLAQELSSVFSLDKKVHFPDIIKMILQRQRNLLQFS